MIFFLLFLTSQGKGTCKTYWLISAVKRPSVKVSKHLHSNGQPLMNYLHTPGHHFGSNSSLNLKRTDSLRRSMKGNSPNPIKKSWHKADDESAALLNQTTVWSGCSEILEMFRKYSRCLGNAREILELFRICSRCFGSTRLEMFRMCSRCFGNTRDVSEILEMFRKCSRSLGCSGCLGFAGYSIC